MYAQQQPMYGQQAQPMMMPQQQPMMMPQQQPMMMPQQQPVMMPQQPQQQQPMQQAQPPPQPPSQQQATPNINITLQNGHQQSNQNAASGGGGMPMMMGNPAHWAQLEAEWASLKGGLTAVTVLAAIASALWFAGVAALVGIGVRSGWFCVFYLVVCIVPLVLIIVQGSMLASLASKAGKLKNMSLAEVPAGSGSSMKCAAVTVLVFAILLGLGLDLFLGLSAGIVGITVAGKAASILRRADVCRPMMGMMGAPMMAAPMFAAPTQPMMYAGR